MDKNDLIVQVNPVLKYLLHQCIGHQEKPLVVILLSKF